MMMIFPNSRARKGGKESGSVQGEYGRRGSMEEEGVWKGEYLNWKNSYPLSERLFGDKIYDPP